MRLFLFLALVCCSCGNDAVPENVLPAATMEAVLHDVLLVDEMVDFLSMQDSAYQKPARRLALYDSVFSRQGISKEAYQKSMAFYQARPALLKTILDSVQRRLDTTGKRLPVPPSPAGPM